MLPFLKTLSVSLFVAIIFCIIEARGSGFNKQCCLVKSFATKTQRQKDAKTGIYYKGLATNCTNKHE
jgi:hypothetical protein